MATLLANLDQVEQHRASDDPSTLPLYAFRQHAPRIASTKPRTLATITKIEPQPITLAGDTKVSLEPVQRQVVERHRTVRPWRI